MPDEKNTTAIIVTYNSESVIGRCIRSLQKESGISTIIVVDNASGDETCNILRSEFPEVRIIKNYENTGFGPANNKALKEVKTDYALLINPDASLEEGCLEALLSAAVKYQNAAILAPILADDAGHTHKSYKRNVFEREAHKSIYHEPEGDLCAEFLSGAVWLVNMKHLQTVGYFDKELFLYYEDDDLCLRVRRAGLGLVLVHSARAVHAMGGSTGAHNLKSDFFKQRHMAYSRLYIEKKYRGTEAAKKLAKKHNFEFAARAAWYTILLNRAKINRYRGRLLGVFEFSEKLKAFQ